MFAYKGFPCIQVTTAQKQWAWVVYFILIALWQRNLDDTEPTEDNTWNMAVLGMDWLGGLLDPIGSGVFSLGTLTQLFLLSLPAFFQIRYPFFHSHWFLWEPEENNPQWTQLESECWFLLQCMEYELLKANNHPAEQWKIP